MKISRRNFVIGSGLATAAPMAAQQAADGPHPIALKTEYIDNPLGLSSGAPRFSWQMQCHRRGAKQSAFRIRVASSQKKLTAGAADLWDSGRVAGDACFEIAYAGTPLSSGQRAWWCVQLWDERGAASAPSTPAWFEMGLLAQTDWRGEWLVAQGAVEKAFRAAAPQWIWSDVLLDPKPVKFRFTFALPEAPATATLWLTAKDALNGVWVNGETAAIPDLIDWGCMAKFPVTLAKGKNLICAEATAHTASMVPAEGGGLIALVEWTDGAGAVHRIISDASWRASNAAVEGWMAPSFDDSAWPHAKRRDPQLPCEPYPAEPARLLRRTFDIDKPVARARLYATALGVYEAHLNGQRVGDILLAPEVSSVGEHVFYQCYDVTEQLAVGRNALGVIVGDGWYAGAFGWRNERYAMGPSPKRLLAQLVIDFADGSRQIVATDKDWRTAESAMQSADIYNGEVFDARRKQAGWSRAGFDDAQWQPVEIGVRPGIALLPQAGPFIRPVGSMKIKSIQEPRPGIFVFDFGQNYSGWCRLKVKGKAGTVMTLRYAEIVKPNGEVETGNLRCAACTDQYVLRGDAGGEIFEPRFTYHGFRYVQLECDPARPDESSLEGVVVHSDAALTGTLACENPLVQRIWKNAMWSQRSNFFGVPTDCPQRDERMGWMGDIQIFLDAAAYNMDVDAFIRRFLCEVRANQTPDGAYEVVMPHPRSFAPMWTAGWSEAGIILPWTLYRRYGDVGVIDANWAAMEKWMGFLLSANPDLLWRNRRGCDLGDWLAVDAKNRDDETTPKLLIATAYWGASADMMAEMAAATKRRADEARYRALATQIRRAFADAFVKADGTVGNGSQAGYAMALAFNLVPAPLRKAAGAKLAADIKARGMKLSTGFLGTPYLLDALSDNGQSDVAISLLLQTESPSWGYMIRKGATTMWERWNGDKAGNGMNSFNHYAYGAVSAFLYRRLAGIVAAEPGFRKILVDPIYDPRIGRTHGEYDSCLGQIATDISGDAKGMARMMLRIPANASATVFLPVRRGVAWSEGGKPVSGRKDMALRAQGDGRIALDIGSGDYDFKRVRA